MMMRSFMLNWVRSSVTSDVAICVLFLESSPYQYGDLPPPQPRPMDSPDVLAGQQSRAVGRLRADWRPGRSPGRLARPSFPLIALSVRFTDRKKERQRRVFFFHISLRSFLVLSAQNSQLEPASSANYTEIHASSLWRGNSKFGFD